MISSKITSTPPLFLHCYAAHSAGPMYLKRLLRQAGHGTFSLTIYAVRHRRILDVADVPRSLCPQTSVDDGAPSVQKYIRSVRLSAALCFHGYTSVRHKGGDAEVTERTTT